MQHNRFLSDAKGKDADVIFIGDSILQALEHTEVWNQWFAPLHCLNFSIHKDQTQNVLWRIKNGELDHVDPKVSRLKYCMFMKEELWHSFERNKNLSYKIYLLSKLTIWYFK